MGKISATEWEQGITTRGRELPYADVMLRRAIFRANGAKLRPTANGDDDSEDYKIPEQLTSEIEVDGEPSTQLELRRMEPGADRWAWQNAPGAVLLERREGKFYFGSVAARCVYMNPMQIEFEYTRDDGRKVNCYITE